MSDAHKTSECDVKLFSAKQARTPFKSTAPIIFAQSAQFAMSMRSATNSDHLEDDASVGDKCRVACETSFVINGDQDCENEHPEVAMDGFAESCMQAKASTGSECVEYHKRYADKWADRTEKIKRFKTALVETHIEMQRVMQQLEVTMKHFDEIGCIV